MNRPVRVQLRVLLALFFLLLLLAQIMLVPTLGRELADSYPEYAYLLLPYVSVVISGLACVQAAVLAAWCLVGLIPAGPAVSLRAQAWATVMALACGAATVLAVLLAWHMFAVVQQGNPASLFALGSAVMAGTVMTLLSLSLRARLGPPPAPYRAHRGVRL
ncbi:DUF2975 domain-containing protein [Arthrobacter sp. Sa2CUA1]|uniref:DUF2975 domain-containing protein n=1 Tax=Arthrobacter gallicola TaxID=2762225 RepID=A0ABR8UQ66_9MICC|nr:DUF2975 domain-containing protein [Arthrobacter gallicola]MBD7994341.1 DUF2975 domain-containing protein [Arthrobacter gallicola]